MSAKTAAPIEIPYNLQGDKPPNLEAITKPIAEAVRAYLLSIGTSQLVVPGKAVDKGKLLFVDNTGAAAFSAMKGDATLAGDGTLSIGKAKILTEMLADGVLTTAKMADGGVTRAKLSPFLQTKRVDGLELAAGVSFKQPVVWSTPFPDANYTASVTVRSGNNARAEATIVEKTKEQIKVEVTAVKGGQMYLDVVAIHD
ncbi:MAG TPA: hypothetical protein VFX35_01555 [Solirubrobacterales bacterium]|nr:hypothetical protein [Solirubrobacterales bacterium]